MFEYILAHKHLREQMACKLFAQLISGVAYLHAKKIVHRDLKLENLLLDRNRNIVITDFGFANRFNESGNDLMATSCGSPCYAAPELVLHDGNYMGSAVDVWSCGVILYAMLSGYLPYDDDPANPDGDNINLLYRYITTTQLSFPDWISPEPRELLLMMLVSDPNRRCSLRDVMRHPWLRRYSPFFQSTVEDLEGQADMLYEEKKVLLARQQADYLRQTGQIPPVSVARSMSTSGVHDSTAQARHRSAMVTSTTMGLSPEMGSFQARMPTYIPAPIASSSSASSASPRRAHAQSTIVVPTSNPKFLDPFASASLRPGAAVGVASSAYTTVPVLEPSSYLSSVAMGPSSSAPGEVETTSDSLTSEGEIRGEPRSRRTDDDDASTSSLGAPRNGRPIAAIPSASTSEQKRRKGDEKRYSMQPEPTSPPPAESTRSKTKQRDSLVDDGQLALPNSVTSPDMSTQLLDATPPQGLHDQPVFVPPADPTLPIIEAAAAAESMDVHMQSPTVSPSQSLREKEREREKDRERERDDMLVEPMAPLVAIPTVSPVTEVAEQPLESIPPTPAKADSAAERTPPASPRQALVGNRTPKRSTADAENLVPSRPNKPTSIPSSSPKSSVLPFPSPKQERPSTAVPLGSKPSGQARETARPSTAISTKAARHRKGMSSERAFFSRFLGSSTTSVDKTDVRGEPSRSRTSSTADGLPSIPQGITESASTTSALGDLASGRNRRRKAFSLVVDPFSRSSSNTPASAAAKNRRSARVQTSSSTAASTGLDALARDRSGSVLTQSTQRSINPPSSVVPSLSSTVNINGSRQSVLLPPSQIPQPVYGQSQDASKSKRVSDWFRWKSVARESTQVASIAATSPVKRNLERKQESQIAFPPGQVQSPASPNRSAASAQAQPQDQGQPQDGGQPQDRGLPRTTPQHQPTVIVTGEDASSSIASPTYVEEKQRQQPAKRVVATPADARQFASQQPVPALMASRSLRARAGASESSSTSFDETKLKIHGGGEPLSVSPGRT